MVCTVQAFASTNQYRQWAKWKSCGCIVCRSELLACRKVAQLTKPASQHTIIIKACDNKVGIARFRSHAFWFFFSSLCQLSHLNYHMIYILYTQLNGHLHIYFNFCYTRVQFFLCLFRIFEDYTQTGRRHIGYDSPMKNCQFDCSVIVRNFNVNRYQSSSKYVI